jgi:elongation factor Ts
MPDHIEGYVHNAKIGVLVHFGCNDEYSLRTKEFRNLARDIAMHIAASKPVVVAPSDLDPKIRNEELSYLESSLLGLGEEERLARVEEANRRINEQFCLLSQPLVKDPAISAGKQLDAVAEELGDSVVVKRFVRWDVN